MEEEKKQNRYWGMRKRNRYCSARKRDGRCGTRKGWGIVGIACLAALLFFYPVAGTLVSSMAAAGADGEVTFTLRHYIGLFLEELWFYPMFWNSFGYGLATALPALVFVVPAGFALAKGKWKHKGALATLYLVLMLMPLQVTILPNYIGLRDLGLLDTRAGIVIPALFSPFATYLMYQYMKGIPEDTLEAARLETNSLGRILLHVVVPQIRTAIAAVFLFLFAEGYNLVEQPQIFLKDERKKPLSILVETISLPEEGLYFAAGIVSMIPVALLFGFFEVSLEEGMGEMKF